MYNARKYSKTFTKINNVLIIKFEQPRSVFYSSFYNAILSNNGPKANKRKLKHSETVHHISGSFASLPTFECPKIVNKYRNQFNCFTATSNLSACCGFSLCLSFIVGTNKRSKRRKFEVYKNFEKPNCFGSILFSPISYSIRRAHNCLIIGGYGSAMDKDNTSRESSPSRIPSVRDSLTSPMEPDIVSEILADLGEVPVNIFDNETENIPDAISEPDGEEFFETIQEILPHLDDGSIPDIESIPVMPLETTSLSQTQSATDVLFEILPEVTSITEPEITIEITPEVVPESTHEPILDVLQKAEGGGDDPSPPGLMSSSSDSDILIEPIFGEAPYYIPNKCQKMCSFEYQVHPEPSTSSSLAPKVVIKRCTRKVTREEEIKKENYRKFQEEMDKIEVVKDKKTEQKKRVSKSPPKPKAKKETKKAPPKSKKLPEPKKRPEPPKRISKRKQANPKKRTI